MKTLSQFILAISLLGANALALDTYYYSNNRQIQLQFDTTQMLVLCDDQLQPHFQEQLLNGLSRVINVGSAPQIAEGFLLCSLSTGEDYLTYLDSIKAVEGISLVEPVFGDDSTGAIYVGDVIVAAFYPNVIRSQVDSLAALFHIVVDHQYEGLVNTYVLRNTDSSGMYITDLANRLYELPETEWSHPLFTSMIVKHAYQIADHYAQFQLHSKKVIGQFNETSVWDFASLRRPVVVAVVDDGVEPHEDLLADRVLPGIDFYAHASRPREDNDPSPGPLQAHGMGCAGIIAAGHTDPGGYDTLYDHSYIFGIAPQTLIRPVKIFGDDGNSPSIFIDDTVLSRAVRYARKNAEVLSCSWGYANPYQEKDLLTQELRNAADSGRNGKGCILVFSSGNAAPRGYTVGFPANLPYCLSVGATDINDYRWDYSQAGPGLGVVAPSGDLNLFGDVWTLDQMDAQGYNPLVTEPLGPKSPIEWHCPEVGFNDENLDCRFGGTSAAAPIVAGVASLILSRDSTLTSEQVYEIIRSSAVTEFSYGTIIPPDLYLGWGRVDAFRAILSIARGDASNDGRLDVADMSRLIAFLTAGAEIFPHVLLGDWNCSGNVDLNDLSRCIAYFSVPGKPGAPVRPCFAF